MPLGPQILCAESARKSQPSACTSIAPVRCGLRGVDDHDRAVLVRPGGELLDRVDRAERVRDEAGGDDLHVRRRGELVERVELELARRRRSGCAGSSRRCWCAMNCHGTKFEWCSSSVTTTMSPGPRLSSPQAYATRLIASVALRMKMTSRASGALTKPRTSRGRPRSPRWPARRAGRRRGARSRTRLVEVRIASSTCARLLRARRRVEERERLAVDELLEDRESLRGARERRAACGWSRPHPHCTEADSAWSLAGAFAVRELADLPLELGADARRRQLREEMHPYAREQQKLCVARRERDAAPSSTGAARPARPRPGARRTTSAAEVRNREARGVGLASSLRDGSRARSTDRLRSARAVVSVAASLTMFSRPRRSARHR